MFFIIRLLPALKLFLEAPVLEIIRYVYNNSNNNNSRFLQCPKKNLKDEKFDEET